MVCFRLERLRGAIEELSGSTGGDLPAKVFELIDGFITEHHAGFAQLGEFASQIARMQPDELERLKDTASSIVKTVSSIMQQTNPQWSAQQAMDYAQIFLWLIDSYSRNKIGGAENLVKPEVLLDFFRRGSKLMQQK